MCVGVLCILVVSMCMCIQYNFIICTRILVVSMCICIVYSYNMHTCTHTAKKTPKKHVAIHALTHTHTRTRRHTHTNTPYTHVHTHATYAHALHA